MHLRLVQSRTSLTFITLAVLALIVSFFLVFIDIKLVIAWLSLLFIVAGTVHKRRIGREVVVAVLFALFVSSYQSYVYTTGNTFIGHINLFPLLAWTAGLVLLREAYVRLHVTYPFLVGSVLYIAFLFLVEYIGYYILNIRIAESHPSLFGLGIIHGPPFIHFFYLFAGPVYLLVTDYLRVK